ncbi:hypothetical protein PX690_21360 [Bacillus velezensis]|uniref:hypothetical protein n=1 Tax=Bacillus velezensis TaxID=492670 RepID=UPI0023E1E359|nr:hypothetical protein [Bacillus velezensis]WES02024.1 hypothetical protein PX690_21360 [Bacillus velezensis]
MIGKAVDRVAGNMVQISQVIDDECIDMLLVEHQELLHICNDHIEESDDKKGDELLQAYAVLGLGLVAMGEDVGQEMVLRQFAHLMHYGEANIRKAVPLAMGLLSPSNPQMKVYDTLSRYSHEPVFFFLVQRISDLNGCDLLNLISFKLTALNHSSNSLYNGI